jgi:hypothetical protein
MTAREVMQYVGTDVFRKIQQNVWADATIYKIQSEKPDLAIVADCRFPNEVEVITAVSGLAIKLNRNPYNSNHASEAALDSDVYDQTNFDLILNNQTLNIHQQNIFIKEFLSSKGVLPL